MKVKQSSLKTTVLVLLVCLVSVNAQAGSLLWKAAGLSVAAVGAYGLYQSGQPQKQLYCNSNDKLMHIIKNNDHVYLDDKGRTVPCKP